MKQRKVLRIKTNIYFRVKPDNKKVTAIGMAMEMVIMGSVYDFSFIQNKNLLLALQRVLGFMY